MIQVATAMLAVGIVGAKAQTNGADNRKFVISLENCDSASLPAIRILQGPKNGHVSMKDGITHCDLITIKTRMLVYRPNNGYFGDDTILYELKYPPDKKHPRGIKTSMHVNISCRGQGSC
jgi:hypothetical protein